MIAALTLGLHPSAQESTPDVNRVKRYPMKAATGRVNVLIFVLAECPIARKFAPEIQRLEREFAKKATFMVIHADPTIKPSEARAHAREFGFRFPVLIDTGRRLVDWAGVTKVPTAVVVDSSGRIRYSGRIDDRFPALGHQNQAPTRRDLRAALTQFSAGRSIRVTKTEVVGCVVPSG